MKIPSERKIVAIAVAVFVAFTTITHAVAVRSPQRVLNAGTVVKTEFKGAEMQPPELLWQAIAVFGLYLYFTYQCMGPGAEATAGQGEYVYVVRAGPGPPFTSNPVSPGTVALVQELP